MKISTIVREKLEKDWQCKYKYHYEVAPAEHPRTFPLDMLRYDGSTFEDEASANRATDTIRVDGDGGAPTIRLVKLHPDPAWAPKANRWLSYGWRVL